MKRLLSILLSICMLLSITTIFNFNVYASNITGNCGDNATYSYDSDTKTLAISGTGSVEAFYEDSYWDSYIYSYFRKFDIDEVIINEGITKIGRNAFEYCNISKIVFPDSVTSIGYQAFKGCRNLKSINIPNGVTSITNESFYNCENLETVDLSDSVKTIGYHAFYGCVSLKEIYIPLSVEYIDTSAFANDNCLSYDVNENNNYYSSYNGILFDKNKTVLYKYPAMISDKSYSIPNSVQKISSQAFLNNKFLESIELSSNLTDIGFLPFNRCENLKDIYVKNIDNFCIYNFGIGMPCNFVSEDEIYFYDYNLYLDNKLLTKLTISGNVSAVGHFNNCQSIKEVVISNGVDTIVENAFTNCNNLEKITLPNTLTKIKKETFLNCQSLKSVVIPESVNNIDYNAFWNCTNLEKIEILNPNCYISSNANTITGSTAIYGYKNSTAHSYASNYNRTFCDIETTCFDEHDYDDGVVIKRASCNVKGTKEYTCNICGNTYTKDIPALNHDYTKRVVKPTCNSKGYTINMCLNCGDEYNSNYVLPTNNHSYTTKVVKSTYAAKGYTLHTCSVCKASYKDKYTNKLTVAKPSISKVTSPKSKQIKVTWGKKSYTGYQVQIATDSKFSKNKKTTTIKKASTTSTAFTKLKGKTKYYVRVRAYKTYNGKNYYSSWSSVKTVITKK